MARDVSRRQAIIMISLPLCPLDELLFILKNPTEMFLPLGNALPDPRVNCPFLRTCLVLRSLHLFPSCSIMTSFRVCLSSQNVCSLGMKLFIVEVPGTGRYSINASGWN